MDPQPRNRSRFETLEDIRAIPPDELVINAPTRVLRAVSAGPADITSHRLRVATEAANRDRTMGRVKGERLVFHGVHLPEEKWVER